MEELLKVNDISMVFGGLRAVSNFSMTINKGELIGLIGPNGAGKTTAFNMITGVYTPTEGEIIFNIDVMLAKRKMSVTELSQRVHQIILKNTTMFRRASKEQPQRTLSMRCLRNWRTGAMQQQRQKERESRQKSSRFLMIYTFMVCKKWRTESHE